MIRNKAMFRVVAEPYNRNKFLWIAVVTFPGQSRYILRDEEDQIRTFDKRDLALLAAFIAFPTILSEYCNKGAARSSSSTHAKAQAERLFVASQRGIK